MKFAHSAKLASFIWLRSNRGHYSQDMSETVISGPQWIKSSWRLEKRATNRPGNHSAQDMRVRA